MFFEYNKKRSTEEQQHSNIGILKVLNTQCYMYIMYIYIYDLW